MKNPFGFSFKIYRKPFFYVFYFRHRNSEIFVRLIRTKISKIFMCNALEMHLFFLKKKHKKNNDSITLKANKIFIFVTLNTVDMNESVMHDLLSCVSDDKLLKIARKIGDFQR